MKQALSPMTIVINLCMQRERIYQRAWKQTFVNTFKLLPYANEMADILAGSGKDKDALIRQIGDIALWNCARTSNKAAFPVSLLLSVAHSNSTYRTFFAGRDPPNTPILNNMLPKSILGIDFSGLGSYRFWADAGSLQYKIRRSPEMTTDTAKEAVFNSVWGSHTEDLSVDLRWMTGHNFQTRRQMGNQLQERNVGTTYHKFSLIPYLKIKKLVSASQTDFLTGGKGQISRGAVFSGKIMTRVSVEDELSLRSFRRSKRSSQNYGASCKSKRINKE